MSQNQDASEIPLLKERTKNLKMILLRPAAFGGGFAVVAALLLAAVVWWAHRPKQWSDRSITAKPTQLMMQQVGDELRFEFRYAFTNHTNAEYTLPAPDMGALMRKLPKDGSFEKMDGATWDGTIRIPPQQSVGIAFLMPYKFSNFNTSAAEVEPDGKLTEFASNRLKEIDDLAFFDYASKYKIEMPNFRNALNKSQDPEKHTSVVVTPAKGDMQDKVNACQQAHKLVQMCKQAGVSLDSSPSVKYGGWPKKLRSLPTPPAGYTLDPDPDSCAIAGEWQTYCKANVK